MPAKAKQLPAINALSALGYLSRVKIKLSLSFDRLRILTVSEGKQKVYYISVVDNEKLLSVLTPNKKAEEPKQEVAETKTEEVKSPAKKTTTAKKKTTYTNLYSETTR